MTIKEFKIQYALGSLSRNDLIEIAKCPSTSGEILIMLSRCKEYWVIRSVSINPNTPASALAKLSNDAGWVIRTQVARNRHTSIKILKKLLHDEESNVRNSARRYLDIRNGRKEIRYKR